MPRPFGSRDAVAVVTIEGGAIVMDEGSTNGTFVDMALLRAQWLKEA